MYVCMYILYICMCVYVCMRACVCPYVYLSVSVCGERERMCVCVCVCARVHTCACMQHVCMCVSVWVHIYCLCHLLQSSWYCECDSIINLFLSKEKSESVVHRLRLWTICSITTLKHARLCKTMQSESPVATNKRTETKYRQKTRGAYKLQQFQIQPRKPRTTNQMDSRPHFDDLNDVILR